MKLTWLCSENTSKIVLFLITFTVLIALASCTTTTTTTATIENSERVADANTLADDLENDEFIDMNSQQPHSRRKRLVWITDDGRLALPPGTSLTFTPTISLPLVRYPPEGFKSNVSVSFPVTIDFDKLGLTDNQNPLGDLPPIFARSFGHSAGKMLSSYMSKYLHVRRKRDLSDGQQQNLYEQPKHSSFNINQHVSADQLELPQLPERFKHIFHGGERVFLYNVLEDFLSTFGMNGKACLLRTICEIHSRKIDHFGVFGEMAKLFLTVTRSPFSDMIPEYVNAQEIGEGRTAPGECFPYHKECPRSLFKVLQNHKYKETPRGEYHEQEVKEITQDIPLANYLTAAELLGKEITENEIENLENENKKIKINLKKAKRSDMYSM